MTRSIGAIAGSRRFATRTVLTGMLLSSASCATASIARLVLDEPRTEAAIGLDPGRSTLGDCLRRLGAPHTVWARPGRGVGIAYRWIDRIEWSVLAEQYVPAQFGESLTDIKALVLLFDAPLRLISIRAGAGTASQRLHSPPEDDGMMGRQ